MNSVFRGLLVGSCLLAVGCAARPGAGPVRHAPAQANEGTISHYVETSVTAPETQRSARQSSGEAGDPTGFGMQRHYTTAAPDRTPKVDQPSRYSPRIVASDPDPVAMPDSSDRSAPGKSRAAAAGAGFQIPRPDAGGIHFKGPKGSDSLEPAEPKPPEPIDPPHTEPR